MCENDLNSLPQKVYLSTDCGSTSLRLFTTRRNLV
nr:MAG TPA: hypothetical protein [Caudoviricetes sp.]